MTQFPSTVSSVSNNSLEDGTLGTGLRWLMRGMTNLPQGNQELLVVKDKVGRPPGELGVSKSMECDIFPSVL